MTKLFIACSLTVLGSTAVIFVLALGLVKNIVAIVILFVPH